MAPTSAGPGLFAIGDIVKLLYFPVINLDLVSYRDIEKSGPKVPASLFSGF